MITYELTASTVTPAIFTIPRDPENGRPVGLVIVPIELRLPYEELCLEGIDALKVRITTAIEKMVAELNGPN